MFRTPLNLDAAASDHLAATAHPKVDRNKLDVPGQTARAVLQSLDGDGAHVAIFRDLPDGIATGPQRHGPAHAALRVFSAVVHGNAKAAELVGDALQIVQEDAHL